MMNFSNDPTTQEILRKAVKFLTELNKRNLERKQESEKIYFRRLALFKPVKLSSGQSILFQYYYGRYEHFPVSYINFTRSGSIYVTDMVKHYINKEYEPDFKKPIEVLSEIEYNSLYGRRSNNKS